MVLTGPDRIVIDIPSAAFDPAFHQGFTKDAKTGEFIVDNNPLLTKVRYSYYSDKPSTIRVVWDLAGPAQYSVSQGDGVIQLSLLDSIGQQPSTPSIPTIPSPPPTYTPPPSGKIFKVVIDAGHGDKDPGAISLSKKTEKSYNLAVALKVNELLKKEPQIQPIMTRSDDTFIELNERAEIANRIGADLFLAIHANSLPGSPATGTETYYSRPNSKALADIIHKRLLAATGLADRKVQKADFVVIKKTTMPAVLTESGFLTNAKDEAILFSEQKQYEIAQALVNGIKEYLQIK